MTTPADLALIFKGLRTLAEAYLGYAGASIIQEQQSLILKEIQDVKERITQTSADWVASEQRIKEAVEGLTDVIIRQQLQHERTIISHTVDKYIETLVVLTTKASKKSQFGLRVSCYDNGIIGKGDRTCYGATCVNPDMPVKTIFDNLKNFFVKVSSLEDRAKLGNGTYFETIALSRGISEAYENCLNAVWTELAGRLIYAVASSIKHTYVWDSMREFDLAQVIESKIILAMTTGLPGAQGKYLSSMVILNSDLSARAKNVYIVGSTRSGKSTLGNFIAGEPAFSTARSGTGTYFVGERRAATPAAQAISMNLIVLDTPGMDDAFHMDDLYMTELSLQIEQRGTASAIIWCVSRSDAVKGGIKTQLDEYFRKFGEEMFKRLVIVVSDRHGYYENEDWKRQKGMWLEALRDKIMEEGVQQIEPLMEQMDSRISSIDFSKAYSDCTDIRQDAIDMEWLRGVLKELTQNTMECESARNWRPLDEAIAEAQTQPSRELRIKLYSEHSIDRVIELVRSMRYFKYRRYRWVGETLRFVCCEGNPLAVAKKLTPGAKNASKLVLEVYADRHYKQKFEEIKFFRKKLNHSERVIQFLEMLKDEKVALRRERPDSDMLKNKEFRRLWDESGWRLTIARSTETSEEIETRVMEAIKAKGKWLEEMESSVASEMIDEKLPTVKELSKIRRNGSKTGPGYCD